MIKCVRCGEDIRKKEYEKEMNDICENCVKDMKRVYESIKNRKKSRVMTDIGSAMKTFMEV